MSTLAAMRARIARELRRGNTLDADINDAIATAIDAYRDERFYWSESRTECLFNTVAGIEFYDKDSPGAAALGRLIIIDFVFSSIGGLPYQLMPLRPAEIEATSFPPTTGQPMRYSWYQERLRLYPMPADVYPIRVAGTFIVPAPGSDVEAGNPWMTKAERLIRSRAKLELAVHRLRDEQLAGDMVAAVDEALAQLKGETNIKTGTGIIQSWF